MVCHIFSWKNEAIWSIKLLILAMQSIAVYHCYNPWPNMSIGIWVRLLDFCCCKYVPLSEFIFYFFLNITSSLKLKPSNIWEFRFDISKRDKIVIFRCFFLVISGFCEWIENAGIVLWLFLILAFSNLLSCQYPTFHHWLHRLVMLKLVQEPFVQWWHLELSLWNASKSLNES